MSEGLLRKGQGFWKRSQVSIELSGLADKIHCGADNAPLESSGAKVAIFWGQRQHFCQLRELRLISARCGVLSCPVQVQPLCCRGEGRIWVVRKRALLVRAY